MQSTGTNGLWPPIKGLACPPCQEGMEAERTGHSGGAGVQTKAADSRGPVRVTSPASATSELLHTWHSSEVTFRKLNLELYCYTSLPRLKTPGGKGSSFLHLETSSNTQPGAQLERNEEQKAIPSSRKRKGGMGTKKTAQKIHQQNTPKGSFFVVCLAPNIYSPGLPENNFEETKTMKN